MVFNEDARVKIPAIFHFVRLGYDYLPLKSTSWDEHTNIFPDIFHVVTELTCRNGGDEFRPDITLLVNGQGTVE